ncbi:hypothetical protein IWQ60_012329 [Tieghemiomyces parasiticus]|uniref:Lysosomal dipeptide transporter MFSD1 n=1 Tax=Tieghemiomyces parasiticus TaxID=78921 RepID=A0A9W8DLG6_9FUNG|nr:hypothetical protein IWQ60_012329 [Tieghemiomyces parasiticus]
MVAGGDGGHGRYHRRHDHHLSDSERAHKARMWKFQALALLCALLLSVGAHYAAHTLGALKATVKKDFGISNTQYGLLQSAVSLVNTLLPVLGGLFIDSFGTSAGSILATSFILLGTTIVSVSTHYQSFATMVVGRLLYGLGSGTIVTIQETILSHWFTGKGLAMTIALQIATARLSSFLSMGTTVPIAEATGFYGYAFWASAFICLCSWTINLVYVSLMQRLNQHMSASELAKLKRKNTFRLRHIFIFPAAYWLIMLQSFVLGSGWTTFLHISSEFVKLRFHADDSTAAHIASVSQLLPVFLVPFLGIWVDRHGHRATAIVISSLAFLTSMGVLGFTHFSPVLGMFIFSVSLSVGPICSISSIPLVLPLSTVGSGLGLYKSAQNIGNTIVDIIVGQLQDSHPLTTVPSLSVAATTTTIWRARLLNEHSYDRVMGFYLFWGSLAVIVAVALYLVDRQGWDRLLQLNDYRRLNWIETHNDVFCHYQIENSDHRRRTDPQTPSSPCTTPLLSGLTPTTSPPPSRQHQRRVSVARTTPADDAYRAMAGTFALPASASPPPPPYSTRRASGPNGVLADKAGNGSNHDDGGDGDPYLPAGCPCSSSQRNHPGYHLNDGPASSSSSSRMGGTRGGGGGGTNFKRKVKKQHRHRHSYSLHHHEHRHSISGDEGGRRSAAAAAVPHDIESCSSGGQRRTCRACSRAYVATAYMAYAGPLMAQQGTSSAASPPPPLSPSHAASNSRRRGRCGMLLPYHTIRYSPQLGPDDVEARTAAVEMAAGSLVAKRTALVRDATTTASLFTSSSSSTSSTSIPSLTSPVITRAVSAPLDATSAARQCTSALCSKGRCHVTCDTFESTALHDDGLAYRAPLSPTLQQQQQQVMVPGDTGSMVPAASPTVNTTTSTRLPVPDGAIDAIPPQPFYLVPEGSRLLREVSVNAAEPPPSNGPEAVAVPILEDDDLEDERRLYQRGDDDDDDNHHHHHQTIENSPGCSPVAGDRYSGNRRRHRHRRLSAVQSVVPRRLTVWNYFPVGVYVTLLLTSWAMFVRYLL